MEPDLPSLVNLRQLSGGAKQSKLLEQSAPKKSILSDIPTDALLNMIKQSSRDRRSMCDMVSSLALLSKTERKALPWQQIAMHYNIPDELEDDTKTEEAWRAHVILWCDKIHPKKIVQNLLMDETLANPTTFQWIIKNMTGTDLRKTADAIISQTYAAGKPRVDLIRTIWPYMDSAKDYDATTVLYHSEEFEPEFWTVSFEQELNTIKLYYLAKSVASSDAELSGWIFRTWRDELYTDLSIQTPEQLDDNPDYWEKVGSVNDTLTAMFNTYLMNIPLTSTTPEQFNIMVSKLRATANVFNPEPTVLKSMLLFARRKNQLELYEEIKNAFLAYLPNPGAW